MRRKGWLKVHKKNGTVDVETALRKGKCDREEIKAFRAELKRAAEAGEASGTGVPYVWDLKYVKKGKIASNWEIGGGPMLSNAPTAFGPLSYAPSAHPQSVYAPTIIDEGYEVAPHPRFDHRCRSCRYAGDWCRRPP